ncbi:glycosyltransferase family 2 protein [Luminiphilus sp.]|nr:glycosyltransferase family 2 protein [Luminiphilus sp.]
MNALVIILNYNSPKDTLRLVNHILNITEMSVCIIDNNSNDSSADILDESFRGILRVTLLRSETNGGYGAGNNIGLRYAVEKEFVAVFLINPDVVINDGNVFSECFKVLKNTGSAVAVGPKVRGISPFPLRPRLLSFLLPFAHRVLEDRYSRFVEKNKNEAIIVYKLYGCFLCVDLVKMKALDFFDEATFLYFEESILAEKSLAQDFTCHYLPYVSIDHSAQGSVSQLGIKQFHFFFKSCFIYLNKYRRFSKVTSFGLASIDVFFRFTINTIRRIRREYF